MNQSIKARLCYVPIIIISIITVNTLKVYARDYEKETTSFFLQADWDKVIQSCESWKKQDPANSIGSMLLAAAHYHKREMKNAEAQAIITFNLGRQEIEKTINYAIKLVRDYPQNCYVHFLLAFVYIYSTQSPEYESAEEEHINEGISLLNKAIKLNPKYVEALFFCGTIHFFAGTRITNDEAIQTIKETIRLEPSFAEANMCLGMLQIEKELFNEAICSFENTIKLSKRNKPKLAAGSYIAIGSIFELRGKIDEALKAYWEAVNLDPSEAGVIASYKIRALKSQTGSSGISNNSELQNLMDQLKAKPGYVP